LTLPVAATRIEGDPWPVWQQHIQAADMVWLLAPESGGVLEKLSRMTLPHKSLGCAPEAVSIAASKSATAACLAEHGVAAVLAYDSAEALATPLLCKPDDGAGCEDTRCFDNKAEAADWLAEHSGHIVQPWLEGEPASISMLCRGGVAWLLACNRQLVESDAQGLLHYRGSVLNGMAQHWEAFEVVARQVAGALPGLIGYVGVDVMVHQGRVTVLEINPRLTTSYVGLRQATGLNPARLVLDLHYNRLSAELSLQRNVVRVQL
jgi:predicted ATP-grasp superfamily ATP-dependent carboligase